MKKSVASIDHPLLEALATVDAAIHAEDLPASKVAAALSVVADRLAKMLADSDAGATIATAAPGSGQTRRRHSRSQDDRVADIRKASREAVGAGRAEMPALYRRARASTRSALRSQVKKLRGDRRTRQDSPGGEG